MDFDECNVPSLTRRRLLNVGGISLAGGFLNAFRPQNVHAETKAAPKATARQVLFINLDGGMSQVDTLDARDDNTAYDIFLRDLVAGTTELVSIDKTGLHAAAGATTGLSARPLSADGRFIVFHSSAGNLVDETTAFQTNAFVRDRVAGKTYLISRHENGTSGSHGQSVTMTPNGQFAVFTSRSDAVISDVDDKNGRGDVYRADLRSLPTVTARLVSINADGTNGGHDNSDVGMYTYDFSPGFPQLSDDGRFVVFESLAKSIGLDVEPWRNCVTTHATQAMVEADFMRTSQVGIKGTPSFVIGDSLAIVGAAPFSDFKKAIDAALARAK